MQLENMVENRYWYKGGTNSNPRSVTLAHNIEDAGVEYTEFLTEIVPNEYFKFYITISSFNGKSDSTGNGLEILFSDIPKEGMKTRGWGFNSYKTDQISFQYTRSYNKKPKVEDLNPIPFNFMFNKKFEFTMYYKMNKNDDTNPGFIGLYANGHLMPLGFNIHTLKKFGIYVGVGGLTASITCR